MAGGAGGSCGAADFAARSAAADRETERSVAEGIKDNGFFQDLLENRRIAQQSLTNGL